MKITSLIFRITASVVALFPHFQAAAEETVRVLDSKSVQSGGRTITFQRIEPPTPEEALPQGETASSRLGAVETTGSRPSLVGPQPWRYRRFELLSLSCTVKESGVTSVRWWHKGKEYRILSSIDFNWLRGIGHFATEEREYSMFMGIGNEMTAETRQRVLGRSVPSNATPPDPVPPFLIEESAKTTSRYVIAAVPDTGAEAEAFRGIDDLHRHFDAHRVELIAQTAENDGRQKERAAYLKAHPPVPQDAVIQFWPKKGSRYLKKEVAQ